MAEKEYIERESTYNHMLTTMCGTGYQSRALDVIAFSPAADVEPVRHGWWEDGAFENSKKCSACGKYATKIHVYNQPVFDYVVCPYCGAKMDGERKEILCEE